MLIGSYELIQSYVANPQSSTFSQPHSFPLDVRHNLLLSKESASSSCKAAYPFVQGSELVAVQIIAVDTERNSGLRKAGYLIKAGHPIQNTVSTGDLNQGRRACRLLETWSPCSHPFAILPVSALSDAQKVTQKARARTCNKLPVASFCTSETAETGRIANGCEQGDHVSRSWQALRPRFKSPVDTVLWIG